MFRRFYFPNIARSIFLHIRYVILFLDKCFKYSNKFHSILNSACDEYDILICKTIISFTFHVWNISFLLVIKVWNVGEGSDFYRFQHQIRVAGAANVVPTSHGPNFVYILTGLVLYIMPSLGQPLLPNGGGIVEGASRRQGPVTQARLIINWST